MSEFIFKDNESGVEIIDAPVYNAHTKKIIKISVLSVILLTVALLIYCGTLPGHGSEPDFEYVVIGESEKTIGIISVGGDISNIEIPATKDGYAVVAFLFSHLDIQKIHVPDTVKYIVTQKSDVEFIINDTNSYISVSDRLLFNKDKTELITCLYLESTRYRNESGKYYEEGYNKYREINSIRIPGTVTKINNAFKSCGGFYNIEVAEDNPNFLCENGALYNRDKTILIKGFGENIKIADSVKKIEDYAFKDCGFSAIEIPFGVEEIGAGSFESCEKLEAIIIPDSVETIGNTAFSGCRRLLEVKLSCNISEIKGCTFMQCTKLSSITIPAGVRNINSSAFLGCIELNDVIVDPDNPRYYSDDGIIWDFEESAILHDTPKEKYVVNIPEGMTILRYDMFNNGRNSYIGSRYFENIKIINIPNSVTKIEGSAFSSCSNLEEVIIPSSVKEIGYWFSDSPDVVLHVESGSYAEQYAKDRNMKYEVSNGYYFQ